MVQKPLGAGKVYEKQLHELIGTSWLKIIIFLKNYKYLASSLLTWQEVAYEAYREFTELVITQRQWIIEILYQIIIL